MRLLKIKLATFREGYVPFYFDAFAEFFQRYCHVFAVKNKFDPRTVDAF